MSRDAVTISETTYLFIWLGGAVFLVAQSLIARWWLAQFGQGPLERLWRWATWVNTTPAPAHNS